MLCFWLHISTCSNFMQDGEWIYPFLLTPWRQPDKWSFSFFFLGFVEFFFLVRVLGRCTCSQQPAFHCSKSLWLWGFTLHYRMRHVFPPICWLAVWDKCVHLRANLDYGWRSASVMKFGDYINMIGYKWGSSLAVVYIMDKTFLMENFEHT